MKKINLALLLCLCSSIEPLLSNLIVDPIVRQTAMAHVYAKTQFEEGLIGTAQIKTVDGYKNISDLSTNDLIYAPNCNKLQEIILIEKRFVPYFYEIQTTNFTIQAAPAQKFYDTYLNIWTEAQNLTDQHCLGTHKVITIQKINTYIQIYKLHTSQHVFEIEHEILAHNFDVVAACDIGLTIGQLVVQHPVLIAIGRTVSLIKLAIHVHQRFQDAQQHATQLIDALSDEDVIIETRNYYESRRKQLFNLLTQYQAMQNVAEGVLNKSALGISLFSNTIPYQSRMVLLPALQTELQYSSIEKQNLLIARQKELDATEKEIINIQLSSAIYFNEILNSYDELLACTDELAQEADDITMLWDPAYETQYSLYDLLHMSIKNITYLDLYAAQLEKVIQNVSLCIALYEQEPKTIILRQTSNILSICAHAMQNIIQTKKYLDQLKLSICNYQQMNQEMLQSYPIISQSILADFTYQAQRQLNEKVQQHKASIKIKQSQIQYPTPPNDPDPNDKNKKKFDKETYEHYLNKFSENVQDIIHMFRGKEGKLKDTSENRQLLLDIVRDKKNCLGLDDYGVVSYAQIESDGTQIWVEVNPLTHRIRNCGINTKPREWNMQTGLKAKSNKAR